MYAQLCKRLSEEAPNFEPANSACTFRLHLLNKCKLEFENRAAALESTQRNHNNGVYNEDEEERRQFAKRKMLGNIKFIGELGKLEILSEGILHRCIQELLVRRGDDPSEDLECLCQIMRTCGRILDTNKGKKLMEQYFDRMKLLTENQDLQPRIRFMLKDIVDLRQDGWIPRKATVIEGPMPINQIRPVEDDRLTNNNYHHHHRRERNRNTDHHHHHHSSHHRTDNDRCSNNLSELFRHPLKTRGGLDDMLMGMNLITSSFNAGNNTAPSGGGTTATTGGTNGPNGFGSAGQRDGGFRGHNQRSSGGSGGGFNNYNNQRGQYKHNQNNANSQYNNQSNKELAPRFKKNFIVSKEEIGDVELRPNSMLFNKASVKTNNIMNSRSSNTMEPSFTQQNVNKQMPQPLLLKEPLPIKQVSVDKLKQSKKDKGPTKDEVLKKFSSLLDEYWKGDLDIKQAINSYKEHKVPDKFAKDVVLNGLTIALDKTDVEQEKLLKLLSGLKEDNALNGIIIQESLRNVCNNLDERENELSATSIILSISIKENLITLQEISTLTENGNHYPLFLLILKQLYMKYGKNDIQDIFNKSKINLLTQLPENDKTKERLSEILDEYHLTFLYPLLRIQGELARQLQLDPNPQSYYKWIKDNIDPMNFTDPGFINALMTVLLKYITQEALTAIAAATSLTNGGESGGLDEKAVGEKEKQILERYQYILRTFLCEKLNLQLTAVYSLQVHFYSLGFPRGQLLRWFMALYDLEIVDEEAFLNWKEDVTDAYPGKGQALFQVNQWLTWLQEAESEEEEGED